MNTKVIINNFNEFEKWLIQNDYDFSMFLDCDLENLNMEDLEKVSEHLKIIESKNKIYIKNNKINDYDKILIYEKIFNFITLKFIDYTTFFTDLNNYNLINLKKCYFDLFEKKGSNIFQEVFIEKIKKMNKKFRNNHYTVIELINLNMDEKIMKEYLDYNKIILEPNYISKENIKNYYISRYGDSSKKYKYRLTM